MGWLRPRHVRGNTALDRILKAFLNNDLKSLKQEDKDILDRISEVDARLRTGNVVKKERYDPDLDCMVEDGRYTRPYQKRELALWQMARFDVSLAQAYADIEMAERFFLTTETRSDREFARGMQIIWGEDAMARAQADGDHRAAAAFYKEINKIKGLDKFDEDTPELKDFRPIEQVIVADPSELGVGFELIENTDALVAKLRKELKKSTVIDRIVAEAEEVDFEEGDEDGSDG